MYPWIFPGTKAFRFTPYLLDLYSKIDYNTSSRIYNVKTIIQAIQNLCKPSKISGYFILTNSLNRKSKNTFENEIIIGNDNKIINNIKEKLNLMENEPNFPTFSEAYGILFPPKHKNKIKRRKLTNNINELNHEDNANNINELNHHYDDTNNINELNHRDDNLDFATYLLNIDVSAERMGIIEYFDNNYVFRLPKIDDQYHLFNLKDNTYEYSMGHCNSHQGKCYCFQYITELLKGIIINTPEISDDENVIIHGFGKLLKVKRSIFKTKIADNCKNGEIHILNEIENIPSLVLFISTTQVSMVKIYCKGSFCINHNSTNCQCAQSTKNLGNDNDEEDDTDNHYNLEMNENAENQKKYYSTLGFLSKKMEIEDNSPCNKFFINGTPDLDKIIFINNINNGMGLTAGHSPISRFINLTNNYEEAKNQETNASIGPSSPYCDCEPSMKNIQGNITVYKCNNIIQNNVEIYSLSCPKNHCKELHQNNYSIFIHNRKIGFDRKILESMVHLLLIGNTFKDCINHAKLFFNDKLPKLSTMHRVLKRYLVFTKLTGIYKKLRCNK